jgi:thiamine-phosphate pyrophosphorylase
MTEAFLAKAGWALRAWRVRRAAFDFPPPLAFFTDESLVDARTVLESLPTGALVVLRDYAKPDRRDWAMAMAGIAKRRRLILLVAGDVRLAAEIGAHGLHLPEPMARHGILSPTLAWVRQGRRFLTQSAHSRAAIRRAARLGADAAFLSPILPTPSHPDRSSLGLAGFRLAARQAPLPILALGGISKATAMAAILSGGRRLAGLAAIRLFAN